MPLIFHIQNLNQSQLNLILKQIHAGGHADRIPVRKNGFLIPENFAMGTEKPGSSSSCRA